MTNDTLPPCRCCGGEAKPDLYGEVFSSTAHFFRGFTYCTNCGFNVRTLDGVIEANDDHGPGNVYLKNIAIEESKKLWIKRNEKNNPFIIDTKVNHEVTTEAAAPKEITPLHNFKVGDRVVAYGCTSVDIQNPIMSSIKGSVVEVLSTCLILQTTYGFATYHYKQCRKLVKKKSDTFGWVKI